VDGLDANREQVKRGMAWAYRKYLHDQSLLQVEDEARRAKAGRGLTQTNAALGIPAWRKNSSVANRVAPKQTNQSAGKSSCGSKRYCKEMASCDEAKFYLSQCGLSHLDKDSDGIPCEKLCGHGR